MIKELLIRILKSIPGWHTSRKIVVFESDDWGSTRMPSVKAYNSLLKAGIPVDRDRYNKFDTLADKQDLLGLFEVLTSVQDRNGSYAKFTPMSLVANPDFKKNRENNFQKYYYETLPQTLNRYGGSYNDVMSLWREGINMGIFEPQFHGREHLNVNLWIKALQANSRETRIAFDHEVYGHPGDSYTKRKNLFMSAYEFDSEAEFNEIPEIIIDGIRLFEELFGYKPYAFMAPCAIWSSKIEPYLAEGGIKVIQSSVIRYEPYYGAQPNKYKKYVRFHGSVNSSGQIYSIRNCSFEPSSDPDKDWVNSCMADINNAFYWKRPAIISPHRVNFIGSLVPENRDRGLTALKKLLQAMLKKWPDIEFMTSKELGELVLKSKQLQ